MQSNFKEACEECGSRNTWMDYQYPIGTYTVRYKLICKDCAHVGKEKRITG